MNATDETAPCLGWDLAGYGDSGSGLCRGIRTGATITATIITAPFICRPSHKIAAAIDRTVDAEIEMLRVFASVGKIYLDVPLELQELPKITSLHDQHRVRYYWQLVKRPVDQVFGALEPLASNLGFAVARAAHILGCLTEEGILILDHNLFETYPAATLQLICRTNNWINASYKGCSAKRVNGQWIGLCRKGGATSVEKNGIAKGEGLAFLANYLCLEAEEGFEIDDDEFDAALCAITGCVRECTIRGRALAELVLQHFQRIYNADLSETQCCPPVGFVVFDRLPAGIQIKLQRQECLNPDQLFTALRY